MSQSTCAAELGELCLWVAKEATHMFDQLKREQREIALSVYREITLSTLTTEEMWEVVEALDKELRKFPIIEGDAING